LVNYDICCNRFYSTTKSNKIRKYFTTKWWRRWFPVNARQLDKARRHYERWGHWTLLLSWVPIIGDPLTLIAGVMREPLWRFLLLVTLAKGVRYGVLAALTLHWVLIPT